MWVTTTSGPRQAVHGFGPAPLPPARGPLTEALLLALVSAPGTLRLPAPPAADPLADDDEALTLYLCYELSYKGLEGVDDRWEWEPSLLAARRELERRFVRRLRAELAPVPVDPRAVGEAIASVLAADRAPSVSRYLLEHGGPADFREFAIHRSAYQLKEADPHTFAIPRLSGVPKAAMVKIQYEEYGDGRAGEMHANLFADTLSELGLATNYGWYLDRIPGVTLSGVNLISLFGLHRRWRGALVGHLAAFEMTSVGPNARYAAAARRLGFSEAAARFFDVHVDADEEHQGLAAGPLAAGLTELEPGLADDVVFGARALCLVEGLWSHHATGAWSRGLSSLRPSAS